MARRDERPFRIPGTHCTIGTRRLSSQCSTMVIALVSLLLAFSHIAVADLSWGSFTKDDCSRCEYRLQYAKLNGIPSGDKWEDYCPGDKGTPATINGYHLVKPVTCQTGWLGVYGYFEVPDSSCSCYWDGGGGAGPNKDTFTDNGCQKSGYHQYSAHLQNIPSTPSGWSKTSWWIFACEHRFAVVNGNDYFGSPSSCSVTTFSGMWGYFNVEDSTCSGSRITPDKSRRRQLLGLNASEIALPDPAATAVSLPSSRRLLQQKNYPFYPHDAQEALAILAITHRGLQAVFALVHWLINSNTNRYQNSIGSQQAGGPSHVHFTSQGELITMRPGSAPAGSNGPTRDALIIPVLDAASTPYLGGHNGYQIPQARGNSRETAGYYSIALQDSTRTQPTVIATQVLTGCTIAILVENGRAYFAHIRPRGSAPSDPHLAGQANRVDLAYNMGAVGGFDGQTVTDPRHYIVYGGNAANEGGYDDGAAHLTAFATTDDVFVILWRQNTAGTILGHRIISLRDVGNLGGSSSNSLEPRSVPEYPKGQAPPSPPSGSGGDFTCPGLDNPAGCATYLKCSNGKPTKKCTNSTPDCDSGAAQCLKSCTKCS